MKKNIEIEDSLNERTEGAIEEAKEVLLSYLQENDCDSLPCLNNDLDYSGAIHEIVDSSVPIYTSEIEDTWFLHSSRLNEAYENAGVGENPRENNGMAAIYCYIMEQVQNWYSDNAQDIFDEYLEKKEAS